MPIDKNITLGKMNRLVLDRFTPPGVYLMSEEEEDVLLPNQYVTDEMQLDDELDVFVYTDSEDRFVSTTLKPIAMVDEFAMLECVDTASFGAFMDWGLMKDLLIPKNRQKTPIHIGDKRFIRIIKDPQSDRLIGVEKIGMYLSEDTKSFKLAQEVSLLVIAITPLGYKVIVNNNFEGLIYKNEVFEEINIGDTKVGFIRKIRTDGKVDVSLQALGKAKNSSLEGKVLELLKENDGILPYNSKSDAEVITKVFAMSKKNFKATLTKLKTEGTIEVKDTGIYYNG